MSRVRDSFTNHGLGTLRATDLHLQPGGVPGAGMYWQPHVWADVQHPVWMTGMHWVHMLGVQVGGAASGVGATHEPAWHVSPLALQSWHAWPPPPQAIGEVPPAQKPVESQQPPQDVLEHAVTPASASDCASAAPLAPPSPPA